MRGGQWSVLSADTGNCPKCPNISTIVHNNQPTQCRQFHSSDTALYKHAACHRWARAVTQGPVRGAVGHHAVGREMRDATATYIFNDLNSGTGEI